MDVQNEQDMPIKILTFNIHSIYYQHEHRAVGMESGEK